MKKHSVHARLAAALVLILPLAACGERSKIEEAVRKGLKDPDSAQFGELYINDSKGKACLSVNAKNGMVGYTGAEPAMVLKMDDGWRFSGFAPVPFDVCRRVFADEA